MDLAIEKVIRKHLGSDLRVIRAEPVGGGCINHGQIVALSDGSQLFVKSNRDPVAGEMFEAEAKGLELLSAGNAIRVPHILFLERSDPGPAWLALEVIRIGNMPHDYWEVFGRQLAQLHDVCRSNQYGLDHDNFLGSSPQPNTFHDDWIEFFADQRIGFQLRLAVDRGYFDSSQQKLGERLINRLPDLLTREPPSLVHGDLWSGNYLCDPDGLPVLIDPAVYYAHREAEFGMIILFGGVDQRFYDGYQEIWPFPDGWADRFEIYKLYHLLNHLNLFGASYRAGCLSILSRFA